MDQAGPARDPKGVTERKAVTEESPETVRQASSPHESMPASEREQLVDGLIAALEVRGVPQGAWLVDISRVRHALQEADGLLRRLEDAIIRDASSSSRPG
jgi:hypothetical protein